jgi:hypothetical protein
MHRWPLVALSLSLAACGIEPAEAPEAPEASTAPAAPSADAKLERQPFVPPTDAKVLQLGEPRALPAGLEGKAHAPPQVDPRVTCRSSRDTMTRRFDSDELEDRLVALGEGEMAQGTVVAEGSPVAQEVVWADESRTRPERIRVLGEGIRDPSGLGLGSTLAELEAALGPFQLTGFEWDYAGTVMLAGTKLEKLEGKLFFRLEPRASDTPEAQAASKATMGDGLFASSDPNVKLLDPVVGEFLMVCPTE